MNIMCLHDWLKPAVSPMVLCFGPWPDGPGMEDLSFLSINLDGGPRPGVVSRYAVVDLWYASQTGMSTKLGGQLEAAAQAQKVEDFLAAYHPDRPFANINLITGIIGPKTADGGRLVYKMTIEITY